MILSISIYISNRVRNSGLPFENYLGNLNKYLPKKAVCVVAYIEARITPFLGVWILVFGQLFYTIFRVVLFVCWGENAVFMRSMAFCRRLCKINVLEVMIWQLF